MPDLAVKSDTNADQKEGSRVVNVTQGGTIATHAGKAVPDDDQHGIAVANARWGARSMGNGGPVS